MLYKSDFASRSSKVEPSPLDGHTFSVIIQNEKETKHKTNSIALAYTPLLYMSALLSMNIFTFSGKCGITKNSTCNKLYFFVVIAIYLGMAAYVKPIFWKKVQVDLPLTITSQIYSGVLSFELLYSVYIITFGNSALYISLVEVLENIDEHFGISNQIYVKRRMLAIILSTVPFIVIGLSGFFESFRIVNIFNYYSALIILLQGMTIIYFITLIYGQVVVYNTLLLSKISKISSSKRHIFENDRIKKILLKILIPKVPMPVPKGENNLNITDTYCWFELMQIYDRISGGIYIFNKIYAAQIILIFNCSLQSTILVICRALSPAFQSDLYVMISDLYFYIFAINIRAFVVTKMSEYLTQEWRKTLSILNHILIYGDSNPEYYSQIKTLIQLVEARKLQLSLTVCPVTTKIVAEYASRIISFTIIVVQYFYLQH